MALDGAYRAVGIGNSLTLCHLAYDTLTIFLERHDGRSGARPLRIGDDDRFAAFHDGHTAIGSTQVNTDNLAHDFILQILLFA